MGKSIFLEIKNLQSQVKLLLMIPAFHTGMLLLAPLLCIHSRFVLVRLGRWYKMVPIFGPQPPVWKTRVEFPTPGYAAI